MNEAKDILALLGIPSNKIKTFTCDYLPNLAKIYIELLDIRGYCPYCKCTEIGIKDYYTVTIIIPSLNIKNVTLKLE